MALPFYLLLLLILTNQGNGQCLVEEKDCDFPFTINGKEHFMCLADEDEEGSGVEELGQQDGDMSKRSVAEEKEHYCHVSIGKKYVQGVCDSGCFDTDEKTPLDYSDPLNKIVGFSCTTKSSACQFPFIWNGVTYTSCTKAGNSEFHWCAVSVDENRNLRDKRGGKCNMDTCGEVIGEGEKLGGDEEVMDDLTLIIIIVLIVVIVLLIVIITSLICYCQKRKQGAESGEKRSLSESELDAELFPNGSRKTTLFDELSIPFIDASCPPSPNLKGSYVFTKTGSLRRASKASSTDLSSDK